MGGRPGSIAGGALDVREFARFFIGGVAGASANLLAVWLVRRVAAYHVALLAGLATGFVVSFILSKMFAFRSHDLARTRGEAVRFVLVYAVGMGCYMLASLVAGQRLLPLLMARRYAELAGSVCGSATMMVTSYFGHRFFTYAHATGADVALFRRQG